MSNTPIVILGTGMAGYTLAKEFRKIDKDSALTLITLDDGANYSKPMLSNGLAKNKTAAALAMQSAEQMAQMLNADIRTHTRVEAIDTEAQSIQIDGQRLAYRQLVLATGAQQLQLPIAGSGADDTLSVNNLEEYARFRERLDQGVKHVAIMGPGLIGCEFANDLAAAEIRSTLIGPDQYPLQQLLPQSAGQAVQRALSALGTEWRLGQVVESIDKRPEGDYQLSLKDGSQLHADLVLSAAGLRPNVALAQAAGLEVNRGICVDRQLRTSNAQVYALGDCAEVVGLVLPYVMPLMNSARALAKTLAGEETPVLYPPMPVAVKTPALPLSVAAPKAGAEGQWHTEALSENDLKVLFKSAEGELLGFVLTGSATAEKQALAKQLPAVLD